MIVVGLVALYYGANLLVDYAVKLAALIGISSLVIGLTVVAFGTSAPELMVNLAASVSGNTDIALGNIVGSNIFNVLFILGASAIICPLVVHQQLLWWDVPVMIFTSVLLWFFSSKGVLTSENGWVFLLLFFAYTLTLIWMSKKKKEEAEFDREYVSKEAFTWGAVMKLIAWIVLGLFILVVGSKFLVEGSVILARYLGVSELVISLTIIAAGTSLPEVATSFVAAMKKERDIAVGNILGSNIFNILAILGISSVVSPEGIPVPEVALNFDIPVMVAAAVVCLPIFFTGHQIYRWEGGVLLLYYVLYIVHVVMMSLNYSWLNNFRDAVLYFLVPLTVLALLSGVVIHLTKRK